jgi:hypothetical protein
MTNVRYSATAGSRNSSTAGHEMPRPRRARFDLDGVRDAGAVCGTVETVGGRVDEVLTTSGSHRGGRPARASHPDAFGQRVGAGVSLRPST